MEMGPGCGSRQLLPDDEGQVVDTISWCTAEQLMVVVHQAALFYATG